MTLSVLNFEKITLAAVSRRNIRRAKGDAGRSFCLLKLVQGQGVGDLTSSNIHVSCPTETDDYAEIIDEEDTYTMPSSE